MPPLDSYSGYLYKLVPIFYGHVLPHLVMTLLNDLELLVAILHAVQGIVMLALSGPFSLPITVSYLTDAPGRSNGETLELIHLPIGLATAFFLLLSAVDHFATYSWRGKELGAPNTFRWGEYAISASIMTVIIAMLTGITELASLLGIWGCSVAMVGGGYLMEQQIENTTNGEEPSPPQDVKWGAFGFATVVGLFPWLAIAIQIMASETMNGQIPDFVYAIYISLLLLFATFPANLVLFMLDRLTYTQYETGYIVLSLTSKTVLAWQIFSATLMRGRED